MFILGNMLHNDSLYSFLIDSFKDIFFFITSRRCRFLISKKLRLVESYGLIVNGYAAL